jgi:hypothetical protein
MEPREVVRSRLAAPRYSDVAFPPYRFTPGRDPHPTADPRGHSYHKPGAPEPTVDPVPPERWRESIDYRYACDLYNHGYWWEAHEAWEGLWRCYERRSTGHRFLQGVIQVAAAHMQQYLGHAHGVERLQETSRAHLHSVMEQSQADEYMGLRIGAFLAEVADYYDWLREREGGDDPTRFADRHDSERYPYIRLANFVSAE